MILRYYIDKIASKLQVTDEDEKLLIRPFVNKAIGEIFRMYPDKLYAETTVATVSGGNTINLPATFWKPIAFNIGKIPMRKVNRWDFSKLIPDPASENLGQPNMYDIMGENVSGTSVTGAIEIISSNVSDTTQTLSVYGEKDGVIQNEVVNVSGTNIVALTLTDYTKLYYASLNNITLGTVTVRYTGAGATVGLLIPKNLMLDFTYTKKKLWLYPYPDGVHTIRVRYYVEPSQLVNDGQMLDHLPSIFDIDIIDRGYIEWLYDDGQKELATGLEEKWKLYMADKIALERKLDRQDYQQRFSPGIDTQLYPQFNPLDRWPGW